MEEQTAFYQDLEKSKKGSHQKPHERVSKKGLRGRYGKGIDIQNATKNFGNIIWKWIKRADVKDRKINSLTMGDIKTLKEELIKELK